MSAANKGRSSRDAIGGQAHGRIMTAARDSQASVKRSNRSQTAKSTGTHGRGSSINKQGISQNRYSQEDEDDNDDESNHSSSASSTLKGIAEVASRRILDEVTLNGSSQYSKHHIDLATKIALQHRKKL